MTNPNPMATLISLSDRMTPAQRDETRIRMTAIIEEATTAGEDPEAVHCMELARAWITSPEFRARLADTVYALTAR